MTRQEKRERLDNEIHHLMNLHPELGNLSPTELTQELIKHGCRGIDDEPLTEPVVRSSLDRIKRSI